ncbi:MAG: response regulator [Planctomycetota bacterium]|jgi:two-component system chemotaxis response regulator CheY
MKIMTVDDSLTMRSIISKVIESLGAEAVQAEDGNVALEKISGADSDTDLVLLDWNMPELNGIDTLKRLKEQDTTKNIPVIMVTTQAERSNVVEAVRVGAEGYVTKPFDTEVLVSKVKKVLKID